MKIIDLLVKISRGEEVPKKIIAGSEECKYFYDSELKDYRNIKTNEKLFEDEIGQYIKYYLNDEVEILDNLEEDKKIPEKLNIELNSGDENKVNYYSATNLECDLAFKINSIIDYLKSKGDE